MADRINSDPVGPQAGAHHISVVARESPNKAAVIFGPAGSAINYRDLDDRSLKLGAYLKAQGLVKGDHVAIMMTNSKDYLLVCWAAQRLGLVYVPINWHLSTSEAAYIIRDCDAKAIFVCERVHAILTTIAADLAHLALALTTGPRFGMFDNLDRVIDTVRDISDVGYHEGSVMFYSSGTTGRPKGVIRKRGEISWGQFAPTDSYLKATYGLNGDTVYLVTAPLYHAASLVWAMNVLRSGGTVVVMETFDPLEAFRLIELNCVTHAQFVPTMFVRMLRLSEDERRKYCHSSLQCVLHAAAPCPIPVKIRMIEWLGPIIHEYYAGSEGNGLVAVDSAAWLTRPGTVGKAVVGKIHIVGEDGRELPPGQDGLIHFSGGSDFAYYKDEVKTASAYNEFGWSTLGDIGHVDEEGFLFIADRRTDLIISGGVNIYPKEVEDILLQHPAVADVAVIGVPNAEYGQEVKAVVELHKGIPESPLLAEEMIAFAKSRIAGYKCPKSVDFAVLPRLPNGKMLKRELRAQYLASPVR